MEAKTCVEYIIDSEICELFDFLARIIYKKCPGMCEYISVLGLCSDAV